MTTTTATTATRPTEVECPTCHAAAGESCHVRKAWVCGQSTTRKGEPRAPHAARVAAARQLDAEQGDYGKTIMAILANVQRHQGGAK